MRSINDRIVTLTLFCKSGSKELNKVSILDQGFTIT